VRRVASPFWTKGVGGVVRRPAVALTLGVLILLAAAYPVLGLRAGTSGLESLPDSTFAKSGAIALEQSFPGTATTDPAQPVITGDIASGAVTTAIARLEASVANDRDLRTLTRSRPPRTAKLRSSTSRWSATPTTPRHAAASSDSDPP
jgi:uncharacterized membrane protein YdfJ with MMPL/SSD domain